MEIKMLPVKKFQTGFTLIELIASMVLMAIMLPSVGLLVVNSMSAIATHNVSLQASVDGGYVQNNFTKHLDGLTSFSATPSDLTSTNLKFTSYNGAVYEYTLRDAERDIIYSRTIGAGPTYTGTLMKTVVVDSSDNDFDSEFIYRDNNNVILVSPTNATIKTVELRFCFLRNKTTYKHSVYVMPDKLAHENETDITL
jgi:prepilin-type N-terminal cleavage/methylation domain-containing protein